MKDLKKIAEAILAANPKTADEIVGLLESHGFKGEPMEGEAEIEVKVETEGGDAPGKDKGPMKGKSLEELRDMAIDKYAPEGF